VLLKNRLNYWQSRTGNMKMDRSKSLGTLIVLQFLLLTRKWKQAKSCYKKVKPLCTAELNYSSRCPIFHDSVSRKKKVKTNKGNEFHGYSTITMKLTRRWFSRRQTPQYRAREGNSEIILIWAVRAQWKYSKKRNLLVEAILPDELE
jgi:hypothetical protein